MFKTHVGKFCDLFCMFLYFIEVVVVGIAWLIVRAFIACWRVIVAVGRYAPALLNGETPPPKTKSSDDTIFLSSLIASWILVNPAIPAALVWASSRNWFITLVIGVACILIRLGTYWLIVTFTNDGEPDVDDLHE